jgi:hypothetical protein
MLINSNDTVFGKRERQPHAPTLSDATHLHLWVRGSTPSFVPIDQISWEFFRQDSVYLWLWLNFFLVPWSDLAER